MPTVLLYIDSMRAIVYMTVILKVEKKTHMYLLPDFIKKYSFLGL